MLKSLSKIIFLFTSLFLLCSFANTTKVLLIGDSISISYGPHLRTFLGDEYELRHKGNTKEAVINLDNPKGANSGDSRMILVYLRNLLTDKVKFNDDIVLLNCGLHDIKTNPETGKKQIELREYISNLDSISNLLLAMQKIVIWINTTPVNDSIHNSKQVGFHRYNKDVNDYNLAADGLFKSKKIQIIDLNSLSKSFPKEAYSDHVHYKSEYSIIQAKFIAEQLIKLIKKKQD